jgi:hypothetical protein
VFSRHAINIFPKYIQRSCEERREEKKEKKRTRTREERFHAKNASLSIPDVLA